MNTTQLETTWGYWNISTNHHFSFHTNCCTYNYSIITINSSQNNILMNKILCSNYFTIDIYVTPHLTSQSIPQSQHGLTSFIPSCLTDSQLYSYISRYISSNLIAFSVAFCLFIYLIYWHTYWTFNFYDITFNNIYARTYRKPLNQHNCKHHQSALKTQSTVMYTNKLKTSHSNII
jgi:hypothetical protein